MGCQDLDKTLIIPGVVGIAATLRVHSVHHTCHKNSAPSTQLASYTLFGGVIEVIVFYEVFVV